MFPLVHAVFAIVGALFGANIGLGGGWFPGALVGACIGYAIAEFIALRGRILILDQELAKLRANMQRRAAEMAAPSWSPEPDSEFEPEPDSAPLPLPKAAHTLQPTLLREPPPAPLSAPPPLTLEELRQDEPRHAPPPPRPAAALGAEAAGGAAPGAAAPGESDIPIVNMIRGFFTGGNALVRSGIIVLFFGVAFLLRYMAEHTRVPIELRLAGVAACALGLLTFGWRLRKSRPGYALALQGGAVGILYLIIFAALHLYALLPATAAFGVLAVLAALSASLALLQNSMAFALLAVTGGFLAPILASTGEGNHVVLFSYYAVLNAVIVVIAWFKAWRPLNLAGFVFTFVIGSVWGVLRYRAEDFSSTEPFLVLFFVFYVAVAVLFTLRQAANLRGYVDGTLVFGLPIVAFGLQSAMLHDRLFSLAYSAAAVSAMYLCIAWLLHRRGSEGQRVLIEAFIALGVAFLTLAVPLALDSRWNAAAWALEGGALVWIGCRQKRRLPRAFGAVLIIAAGLVVAQDFDFGSGKLALKLGAYFGVLCLSAAAVFSARTLHSRRQSLEDYEQVFAAALFLWGLFWWLLGGAAEITQYVPHPYVTAALLSFAALTALMSSELHQRINLGIARLTALLLLPVMLLYAADAAATLQHPFAQGGWVSWPIAFAIFYVLAHRHEGRAGGALAKALHVGSAWLSCALLSWEASWAVNAAVHGGESWRAAAWAMIAVLAIISLPRLVTRVDWPFRAHREAYLFIAGIGIAVYLGFWSFTTNFVLRGDAAPLPYLPLLNPLDIAQAFVFVTMLRYWKFLRAVHLKVFAEIDPRLLPTCFAGLSFIWANGVLLRTLHQWGGVPFSFESFAQSTLTQTALSIFWALVSLGMMLAAARKARRIVWLAGAALLAVTVAKLFLVDLSRIGSIERIVSFLGVGALMLLVGYLSPLPPAMEQRR